jgi:hypothetical protein
MEWLVIKYLEYRVNRAEKVKGENGSIVEQAYDNMIKNYKHTISFLEAESYK